MARLTGSPGALYALTTLLSLLFAFLMSMWLSNQSVSLAVIVATGWRAMHCKAASLAHPSTLRRAQSQVVRLITVVAGH
jgi:hypothetical protein